jgi:hypothetical protein
MITAAATDFQGLNSNIIRDRTGARDRGISPAHRVQDEPPANEQFQAESAENAFDRGASGFLESYRSGPKCDPERVKNAVVESS